MCVCVCVCVCVNTHTHTHVHGPGLGETWRQKACSNMQRSDQTARSNTQRLEKISQAYQGDRHTLPKETYFSILLAYTAKRDLVFGLTKGRGTSLPLDGPGRGTATEYGGQRCETPS
jgi:hypothetical protein